VKVYSMWLFGNTWGGRYFARWPPALAGAEEAQALADVMKGETANTCSKLRTTTERLAPAGSGLSFLSLLIGSKSARFARQWSCSLRASLTFCGN